MTIQEYLSSLRGKTAAVLGIGVSNTPLIELLCRNGVQVIACDKKSREALGERAPQLEALGAQLHLGEAYLADIALIYAMISFLSVVVLCKVYKTLPAKRMWDVIMSSTYDFAEPGFVLIDRNAYTRLTGIIAGWLTDLVS